MKKKLVSIIDQRLVALAQQNQVEALRRVERLARDVGDHFETAKQGILTAITGGHPPRIRELAFEETLILAIKNAKQVLLDNFPELAHWYHGRTVDAYLDAIPHEWLIRQLPEAEQELIEGRYVEENAWLNFSSGRMEVSRNVTEDDGPMAFGIPLGPIQLPKLTDEEKISVIRDVLFPPPSQETIERIIETPDAQTGVHWTDRLEALSHKITDKKALFNQLAQGYADGENLQQLTKRVDPLVAGIRSSAMRIAQTEGLRVAERIQREAWTGLGDLIIGAQILAVLDENTRPHHSTRNGTIYYRNPPTGERSLGELPDLPDEPNCRCWTKPVLNEPEEPKDDPDINQASQTNGASVSYEEINRHPIGGVMTSRVPPPGPERDAWKKKNARFGAPLMVIALKEGWEAPVLDGEERHDLLPDEAFVDGVNPYFEDQDRPDIENESLSTDVALPDDVAEFLEECSDEVAELIRNSEAFKKWKKQDSDSVDETNLDN